jgi:DNA-binding NtrC family response regulator
MVITASPRTPSVKKQLLIVEDDADLLRALRDRLEMYGYEVTCTQNGRHATVLLRGSSFHGLLLDLNLPELDGAEVLKHARQVSPDLPVLVMSVSASRICAVKQTTPGATCEYLLKPFSAGDFKTALQACFGTAQSSSL